MEVVIGRALLTTEHKFGGLPSGAMKDRVTVTGNKLQVHMSKDSSDDTKDADESKPTPRPPTPRARDPAIFDSPSPTLFIGLFSPLPTDNSAWSTTPRPEHLPVDFDWKAYLDYNPDVRAIGADSSQLAAAHYLGWGFREARVYKRIRLVLRYTACGGLMNQHYSHVAAMTLGTALGAHIVMPHALRRDSFGEYFNTDPKRNKVHWAPVPFDTLWNSEYILKTWHGQGMEVQLGPVDPNHQPNYHIPQEAFQVYPPPHFKPEHIMRLEHVYLASRDMEVMLQDIRKLVVARAAETGHQIDAFRRDYPPLVLDLPCTLFSLQTSTLRLATQVAAHLEFSQQIQGLAERVLAAMAADSPIPFNGLHLRVEEDATDWANILGGRDQLWNLYTRQCETAKFSSSTQLYIATGLLSYKDETRMAEVRTKLQPYASKLCYKELYLTEADMAGLHPEQLALIDFLVLVRSSRFVGISVSTFSVFIREYRYVRNISPRSSTYLVDGRLVGTEPLFARGAVFP